jgi:16S rRNA (guanine527-N7)-methyltransferase
VIDVVVPPTPAAAAEVFGPHLAQAEHFVRILADTGISRGLIGPREASRLWDRHVLNCAVVHGLIPAAEAGQRVIDVGSGAGLPGLAVAIVRPDLEVHLVEPLARRTAWLLEVTAELGLDNVTVHTARAEAMWGRLTAPWVTARAVAGIVQLSEWTLPLLSDGGSLLALKGSKAQAELDENLAALRRLGVTQAAIEEVGGDVLAEPTTVLRLTVAHAVDRRRFQAKSPSSSGSARRRSDRPRRPRRRSRDDSTGDAARAVRAEPPSAGDRRSGGSEPRGAGP